MEERSLEEIQREIEEKQQGINQAEDMKELVEVQETNNIQTLPITNNGKVDNETVSTFKNQTLTQIQHDFTSGKVDADEGMKQIVNVLTIVEATQDEKLRKDLKKDAAKSMKSYMKGIAYKDEEKKLDHRQKRNEAFYNAFRPVLEFDLSHLIGKKRKRVVTKDPQTRKKTVTYEEIKEEPRKTYNDRSYGLVLMMVMISLFIIPYCIANVLLAIGRLVNAMFECFNQFGRTAFWFCTSIAGIGIIGLVVYVLLLIVQSAFGVHIFA